MNTLTPDKLRVMLSLVGIGAVNLDEQIAKAERESGRRAAYVVYHPDDDVLTTREDVELKPEPHLGASGTAYVLLEERKREPVRWEWFDDMSFNGWGPLWP